jgi:hypothetical protein
LPKEVMEKMSVKNREYLQYLLINNEYVIIKRFDEVLMQNVIGQVGGKEAKISAK